MNTTENMRVYYRDYTQEFREAVKKGPPSEYRWKAWQVLVNFNQNP
jgi:hypothetical protein